IVTTIGAAAGASRTAVGVGRAAGADGGVPVTEDGGSGATVPGRLGLAVGAAVPPEGPAPTQPPRTRTASVTTAPAARSGPTRRRTCAAGERLLSAMTPFCLSMGVSSPRTFGSKRWFPRTQDVRWMNGLPDTDVSPHGAR